MSRLPPYGRHVSRILHSPSELAMYSGCNRERGSVWIATGPEAWDWRRNHPLHLVLALPATCDPADFDWSFLEGHDPILIQGPDADDLEKRRAIAAALFRDGVMAALAIGKSKTIKMQLPDYLGAKKILEDEHASHD